LGLDLCKPRVLALGSLTSTFPPLSRTCDKLIVPIRVYMSTIGGTYLTVALLPVRPIYHGTGKHYSIEKVLM